MFIENVLLSAEENVSRCRLSWHRLVPLRNRGVLSKAGYRLRRTCRRCSYGYPTPRRSVGWTGHVSQPSARPFGAGLASDESQLLAYALGLDLLMVRRRQPAIRYQLIGLAFGFDHLSDAVFH